MRNYFPVTVARCIQRVHKSCALAENVGKISVFLPSCDNSKAEEIWQHVSRNTRRRVSVSNFGNLRSVAHRENERSLRRNEHRNGDRNLEANAEVERKARSKNLAILDVENPTLLDDRCQRSSRTVPKSNVSLGVRCQLKQIFRSSDRNVGANLHRSRLR